MIKFIVYDNNGKILRSGSCQDNLFEQQAKQDEFVIEGKCNDYSQKIDIINKEVIEKTLQEIEDEKPIPVPFDDQIISITNKEYQNLLNRLNALENK